MGDSGIVKCCDHAPYRCLPGNCRCYAPSVTISVTDEGDYNKNSYTSLIVDYKLLHEPITKDMLMHDPYTPESADSHSPNPEKTGDTYQLQKTIEPELLKTRLENILQFEQFREKEDTLPRSKITRSLSQGIHAKPDDEQFRNRTMSEIPNKLSHVRLISSPKLRLESHHSSSEEEWYEIVVDEKGNKVKKAKDGSFYCESSKKDCSKKKRVLDACCCLL